MTEEQRNAREELAAELCDQVREMVMDPDHKVDFEVERSLIKLPPDGDSRRYRAGPIIKMTVSVVHRGLTMTTAPGWRYDEDAGKVVRDG
jgi:hypothetical protein